MKLGRWLQEKHVTLEEFGQRIGRTHSAVSRYVTGQRMPSRETMVLIQRETGGEVTPGDFYDDAAPETGGGGDGTGPGVSCAPHAA